MKCAARFRPPRCIAITASLLTLTFLAASAPVRASYDFSVTSNMLRPGFRAIYGTKFPWYDRLGNFVTTLRGSFTVNFYNRFEPVYAHQITVTVAGKRATVTENPTDPTKGEWSCDPTDHNDTIAPTAGNWEERVQFDGPPGFGNHTSPNPVTAQWIVFTVLPHTIPNIDNDVLYTANALTYQQGPPPNLSSATVAGHNCREIHNGFVVTGPANDFTGIVVGIVQTLNQNSTRGTVPYTKSGDPGTTGTRHDSFLAPGVPFWDGVEGTIPCYYSTAAKVRIGLDIPSTGTGPDGQGNYSITYGYWASVLDHASLDVLDSPNLPLDDKQSGGATYTWGIQDSNGLDLQSSNCRYDEFEDMLVASADSVPDVVVPIYGYVEWNVTFGGWLAGFPASWVGGLVASSGVHPSIQPVADAIRGPANSKEFWMFTVP